MNTTLPRHPLARSFGAWFGRHVANYLPSQMAICLLLLLLGFWTNRAGTTLLPPGSGSAFAVIPPTSISSTNSGEELHYVPVYMSATDLFNSISRLNIPGSHWRRGWIIADEIRFQADSRPVLESLLKELRAADVPSPGSIALHGRVTDLSGRPLANAQVDLIGDWSRINYDMTRADGTFSIVLNSPAPPPEIRCALRFRIAGSSDRFFSRTVTLGTGPPAGILVSRTILEQFDLFYWMAGLVVAIFLVHDVRRVIRKFRRRPGTCTACGYDLRGSVSERCSECGMLIPLHVRAELGHYPDRP